MTDDGGIRHLFSAIEAEKHLRIKASTVRSWARRKLLYSYGLNERNHPMYDRDHLVALRDKCRSREYNRVKMKVPPQRGHARGQAD